MIGLRFKRNKHKCNLHYAAIIVMTSQILKSAGFTKTQKSQYLENEALFFLQIKNSLITHQALLYDKEWFFSGGNLSVTFVTLSRF